MTTQKTPAIAEDTFSAIQNFLSRNIRDRNFRATEVSLNSPFWKWILANFHHGTFMYVVEDKSGEKRNSFPKHNSAMFHNACEYLSLADMYQSKDMLEFILPSEMQKPYLQHPSSLSKRNRSS